MPDGLPLPLFLYFPLSVHALRPNRQIIAARRVLLSSSNSLTSRARRSLARNSLFRTMMSLGGDPGSGDSDSNGDGGGIDDDPLASFSLSALGALGALGGGGGRGGGAGARAERSILNDFLGQFIQSGNATTVRNSRNHFFFLVWR